MYAYKQNQPKLKDGEEFQQSHSSGKLNRQQCCKWENCANFSKSTWLAN